MTKCVPPRAKRYLVGVGAVAAVLILASPVAAQGTAEQREACTPDAVRLCPDAIPDVERTTACMQAHERQLSRACRRVFEAERRAPPAPALEEAGRAAAEPDPTDERLYAPRRVRPGPDPELDAPRRVEGPEPPPYDDGLGPRRYLYLTPRGLEVETPEDAN